MAPAVTLTRLSGLIVTIARHSGSSVFWIWEATTASSGWFSSSSNAWSIESSSGSPRNRRASRSRFAEASSGCLATFGTTACWAMAVGGSKADGNIARSVIRGQTRRLRGFIGLAR